MSRNMKPKENCFSFINGKILIIFHSKDIFFFSMPARLGDKFVVFFSFLKKIIRRIGILLGTFKEIVVSGKSDRLLSVEV